MPIRDLGYRGWTGKRSLRLLRPLAITGTSMKIVWRGAWLRRLLLLAWLPAIPMGVGFFIFEQSLQNQAYKGAMREVISGPVGRADLAEKMAENPEQARHDVWAAMLLTFFRYPQALNMVVMFGLIAPRIISYDLRSRAYLLYFSRPLTVVEYLIGKGLVLVSLLALTVTIPALTVFVMALALSPDMSTIFQVWDMPLRILVASLSLAIPTAAVAICYSSFTTESRYASFGWFATWILGWVTYGTISSPELMVGNVLMTASPQTRLISPYHALGEVQAVIYGVPGANSVGTQAMLLIFVVTIVAMVLAYMRVAGQLRK